MIRNRRTALSITTAALVVSATSLAWAASGWTTVPTPDPGPAGQYQTRELNGVAAATATDAWAVGSYLGSANARALLLHYDGSAWQRAKIPKTDDGAGDLVAVAADGPSTAYAVGYQGTLTDRLYVLHYNGRRWHEVNEAGAPTSATIYAIAVHSIHHVWIVGYDRTTNKPLALEWTSPGWVIKHPPLPSAATAGQLNGVGFIPGTTKLIAVGYTVNSSNVESSYAVRWSGSSWHLLSTPHQPVGQLRSIAVRSASNAWAVGTRYPNSSSYKTLIEHWNGSRWSVVKSPNRSKTSSTLLGVAAATSSDLIAVGYSCAGASCTTQTLSEQYNGKTWSIIASKNPTTAKDDLGEFFAASAVPGRHEFWGVGTSGPGRPANGGDLTLSELFHG